MYRRFEFEGGIHESLACVPFTVRRKLDLAGLKISLAGWQALTRAERLALCHLPVDAGGDLEVYREVLSAFAARAGVELTALPGSGEARPWAGAALPGPLRARLAALDAHLDDARWSQLDEESRYALYKLADPKRDAEKLGLALRELGLLEGAGARPAPADAGPCALPLAAG
jgi:hypothetical protein